MTAEEGVWRQEFRAWRSKHYVYGQAPEVIDYAEQAYVAACASYASRLRAAESSAEIAGQDQRRALAEWHLLHQRLDALEEVARAALRDPSGEARSALVQLVQAPRPVSPADGR